MSVQVTNLPPPPLCDTSEPTAKQPGRGWWRGCLRQRTAREGWVKGTKTKTKATEVAFFSPLIATCNLPPGGKPRASLFSLGGLSVC